MSVVVPHLLIACALIFAPDAIAVPSASPDSPVLVAGHSDEGRPAPETPGRASAQAALAQGNQRLKEGDPASAIAWYRRAQDSYPSAAAKVEFNIAKAEEARGDEAAAATALELFLAQPEGTSPEFREDASGSLARLRARLGGLQLANGNPGLALTVDGRQPGATPGRGTVWVRPGTHAVKVTEGDRTITSRNVQVAAGNIVELDVAQLDVAQPDVAPSPLLSPVVAAPADQNGGGEYQGTNLTPAPVDTARSESSPLWKKWWFWAAGAALVVGTVLIVVLPNRCEDGVVCMTAKVP